MKTVFYQVGDGSIDGSPLNAGGMIIFSANECAERALKIFFKHYLHRYSPTYSAGHHGEPEHEWVYSHYEIYDHRANLSPTIVLLHYKFINSPCDE